MKLFVKIIFLLLLSDFSFGQKIKIISSSVQITHMGMGGEISNYIVEFKKKQGNEIVIDSVVTITEKKKFSFSLSKQDSSGGFVFHSGKNIPSEEMGTFHIQFGLKIFSQGNKNFPQTPVEKTDMTKGVIVFYHSGNKKMKATIKSFAKLKDITNP